MKKFGYLKCTKYMVAFMFALVFTWGCATSPYTQFVLQGSNIAVEISLLEMQFARIETILTNIQTEHNIFTYDEWDTLEDVQATIHGLLDKFSSFSSMGTFVTLSDVNFMWTQAVQSYSSARNVIATHKAEIPPSSWLLLEQFDTTAESVNSNITKLMADPTAENITKVLTLIVGVVGLAVKIMGVAII